MIPIKTNEQLERMRVACRITALARKAAYDAVAPGVTTVSYTHLDVYTRQGKGSPEYWVAVVKPGRVLFEIAGVSEEVAREALRLASHKLPVKTKFVARETKIGGCLLYTSGHNGKEVKSKEEKEPW